MEIKLVRFISRSSSRFPWKNLEPHRLRLRGLKRPLFPAGVEWPPLHYTKISNYCIKTKNKKTEPLNQSLIK